MYIRNKQKTGIRKYVSFLKCEGKQETEEMGGGEVEMRFKGKERIEGKNRNVDFTNGKRMKNWGGEGGEEKC